MATAKTSCFKTAKVKISRKFATSLDTYFSRKCNCVGRNFELRKDLANLFSPVRVADYFIFSTLLISGTSTEC